MPRQSYPADLTDAEWAILEPLIPAPKPGGRPALHARRELVDAIRYVLRGGASPGGRCPMIFRPGARSTIISGSGDSMAPGSGPIPACGSRSASGRDDRPHQPPRFWTASPPGPLKKGGPRL